MENLAKSLEPIVILLTKWSQRIRISVSMAFME